MYSFFFKNVTPPALVGLCNDSAPVSFGVFDFLIAPKLLYYSYIPIILLALILSALILVNDRKNSLSVPLIATLSFYVLWIANIFIQWIGVYHIWIYHAWQATLFFEAGIFLSSVFLFVNLTTRSSSKIIKIAFSILYTTPVLFLFSDWNIAAYDSVLCQGTLGPIWKYLYIVELSTIIFFVISSWFAIKANKIRKPIFYLSLSLASFLGLFSLSNIVGELFGYYQINLFGSLGFLAFIVALAYLIIHFGIFKLKFFVPELLSYGMILLVSSLLFINDVYLIKIAIEASSLFLVWLARELLLSVKREAIAQEKLKELANKLEKNNVELSHLNKLKTEFVSLASHQLRSPLTAIKGYVSMLLEGDFGALTKNQTEAADRVFQSTEHLIQVVEDLLNVSKIEQGGMQYTIQLFDLKRDLLELVNEMQIIAQKRGLVLSFDFDPNHSYAIKGDREKLRQVFLNLIDNAIKYTKEGSVSVHLKRSPDEKKVLFSVVDTGVGIDPLNIPKLFEKFGRGEAGKMNTGGSGLGLYLAKEIVGVHGGTVSIASLGLGKGSTFTVEMTGAV